MKNGKNLAVVIVIIGILYAAIFSVVLLVTIFLPSAVYDNPDLIAGKSDGSANKVNYKVSTRDSTTTINCKKMTGMDTIWEYKVYEDKTLQMDYTLNVTSGKAKLVLITSDNTITTLAEQDGREQEPDAAAHSDPETSSTELNLKRGTNRIRIVCGKGTAFSLSFNISG